LTQLLLKPLCATDYDIVLAWWGIPEVRAFTTLSQQPKFEDLVTSFETVSRKDFIAWFEGRRIGRTCLIDHIHFEEVSVYVCELGLLNRGFGSLAIRLTINNATKPVRCRIRKDNMPSIRTFHKLGFEFLAEDLENIDYAWFQLNVVNSDSEL
jgi:RimJ/RimL family protein N-acetyltransferase